MKIFPKVWILLTAVLMISAFGCKTQTENNNAEKKAVDNNISGAIAVIHPLNGSDVTGTVYFKKLPEGIEITADINGLTPGKHGFHVHEYGDLRAEDGSSAGGHFNPFDEPHGGPTMQKRHVGDLGNIEAPEEGTAHYQMINNLISFSGESSIIGRSIIIHEGEDDFTTQPSGNSGKRIAGGVIGIANPKY